MSLLANGLFLALTAAFVFFAWPVFKQAGVIGGYFTVRRYLGACSLLPANISEFVAKYYTGASRSVSSLRLRAPVVVALFLGMLAVEHWLGTGLIAVLVSMAFISIAGWFGLRAWNKYLDRLKLIHGNAVRSVNVAAEVTPSLLWLLAGVLLLL